MTRRQPRRGCGLAFGLLLTWGAQSGATRADEPAVPLQLKTAPALIEIQPTEELDGRLLSTERVQERHPNRTLKVERVVAQDETGNYFNHGLFTAWDDAGRMSGRGEYRHNKREGKWTRWFTTLETADKFTSFVELGFQAPFTSQADFESDQLNGAWTIVDAKQRPVAAWEFDHGSRHGLSVWYYPDGKKYREAEYRDGDLDGMVREWSSQQKLVQEEKFVSGFRLGVAVEYYESGELKSECEMLFAKLDATAIDDWWNGTTDVHTNGRIGRDQRHGKYQAWDRDGHLILAGAYFDDHPNGKFTWWFGNGNKAIEGAYVNGKQDGLWTWYHENGLKEIVGEYAMGYEAGRWLMWADDGRVAETMEIHGGASAQPAITGSLPTLQAPDVPQIAPATAVEFSPQPSPAPVRRVTFEQLSFPNDAPTLLVPTESVPMGSVPTESVPTVNFPTVNFPTDILTEIDPTAVVEVEQATTEAASEAKPVLKAVAERPEAGKGS